MTSKLKHIFIFICVLSVISLTLQASITNSYKSAKKFKIQNQTSPITEEEEEESHEKDEKMPEIFYTSLDHSFISSISIKDTDWSTLESKYISYTKSIPIPPPKF